MTPQRLDLNSNHPGRRQMDSNPMQSIFSNPTRYDRTLTIRRLRTSLRGISLFRGGRRTALKVARAEVQDLKRLLTKSGIVLKQDSRIISILGRCFFQRQLKMTRVLTWVTMFSFLMYAPLYLGLIYFKHLSVDDVETIMWVFVIFLLMNGIYQKMALKWLSDDDMRRIMKYSPSFFYKYLGVAFSCCIRVIVSSKPSKILRCNYLEMFLYMTA